MDQSPDKGVSVPAGMDCSAPFGPGWIIVTDKTTVCLWELISADVVPGPVFSMMQPHRWFSLICLFRSKNKG